MQLFTAGDIPNDETNLLTPLLENPFNERANDFLSSSNGELEEREEDEESQMVKQETTTTKPTISRILLFLTIDVHSRFLILFVCLFSLQTVALS